MLRQRPFLYCLLFLTGFSLAACAPSPPQLGTNKLGVHLLLDDGRFPPFPDTGWTPWLADERVVAVTPFTLDGNPAEWRHTNWLEFDADGRIIGWHIDPAQ